MAVSPRSAILALELLRSDWAPSLPTPGTSFSIKCGQVNSTIYQQPCCIGAQAGSTKGK